ncbi:MAG: SDR family oxidoreductase [Bacteroidales bacterium]|nr:SDR family oxidoreductase [Bacteroidales bacterium]MCF6342348.1 SDR family oxidoreductase [Bacteroidales bacterium]
MNYLKGKTVWITGASSGIGEQLAYACAKRGARLILSARRESSLDIIRKKCRLLGADCFVAVFDLSIPEQVDRTARKILSEHPAIDVLINNGGISQRSTAVETSAETVRKIMEVNFFAAVRLSQWVVPVMIKNGGGVIAVTSSIAGKFGFPLRSAYAASKHALHGYFESLRLENRNNNIQVTLVCPGRVKTEISLNALSGQGTVYGKMDSGQKSGMSAERCAEKYIAAIEKNKREVLIGGRELMMVHLKRFLPALFYKIASRIKTT